VTTLNQSFLLLCVGTAAAQQEWVKQWQFLQGTSAWLHTLGIPRDAQKFDKLDVYRQQSKASAVVVFMGAAQSQADNMGAAQSQADKLVQLNIDICALHSRNNPAVQQYALVGSIATLDTVLSRSTSIVSLCQESNFIFQSVHTTDTPRYAASTSESPFVQLDTCFKQGENDEPYAVPRLHLHR